MEITALESIKLQFHPKQPPRDGLSNIKTRDVFLLKVHTNKGLYGIGEAFALGTINTLESIVNEILTPLLVGEDPTNIERLWEKMYKYTFRIGRRGIILAAISAVDIALWDILGKITNMPVYKLLGGYSNKINVYASGGYYMKNKTIQDLAQEALSYKKMNIQAMKMKIGGLSIEEDVERIRAVRKSIGNDMKLAIDANNSYNVNEALRLCGKIEDLDIFFFEEPISTDYIANNQYLTKMTTISIAGYETEYTRFGLKQLIDSNAINIVQTDVIWAGGISEAIKIANIASASGLEVIPHFSAGAVSLAANLHFSLALGNCHWYELTLDENPLRDNLSLTPHNVNDGKLICNELPGIGIEIDNTILEQYRI